YLQSIIDDSAFYTALLIDDNGTIMDVRGADVGGQLSRTDIIGSDESGEPYFETSLSDGRYIASPETEANGRVTMIMAAAIIQNGTREGVLAAAITVYDPAVETEPHGLFDSLSPLNTTDQSARVIQPSETGEIVMAGPPAGFEQSLTSRARSAESGWIVEVERDRGELLDRLDLLQSVQFGSLLIIVLSILGLGFYEYRTNLRQTQQLLGGFEELTDGNFGHELELTAATEWRQIGDGFNEMADSLAERERQLKERERAIREREQRLSVLNRVLRHNLQNDMNVIQGYAELVPEAESRDRRETAAAKIIETSQDLVDHGKKARQLETIMKNAAEGPVGIDLVPRVETLIESYDADYPEFTVHTDLPDSATVLAVSGIEFGIESLIENAFEHNDSDDPEVWITVDLGEDVLIEIRDNGSGIPEHERSVLDASEETSLEHGSGIGLWLAHWAVRKSGGELEFDADSPGGVARVRLPRADEQADA
ncbi:MAG: signal transduction histidine kinase, partial [Natronomonas sp.]